MTIIAFALKFQHFDHYALLDAVVFEESFIYARVTDNLDAKLRAAVHFLLPFMFKAL